MRRSAAATQHRACLPMLFARRSLGALLVHLSQFSNDFARDLFAARAPFGRLLDTHQVKRVVQARAAHVCCV